MADLKDLFKGFSKLPREERLRALEAAGVLTSDDVSYLEKGGLKETTLGEKFIENVIGWFQMPMGVATNFHVDGRDVVIPMVVEETSIVAAASKTAKWVRENGEIKTEVIGTDVIGQIQIAKVRDFANLQKELNLRKQSLIDLANQEVASGLVRRGGGVTDLKLREVPRGDGTSMAVIHVHMNPCDAMGANILNQVCEYLRGPIETFSLEKVTMCILSNLVDSKITKATVTIKVDEELGLKIQEASLFAQQDPYRAATNNKGVLNGIDPVLIATGNDWRAVEAGIHAYACRDGQYRSITRWNYSAGLLTGVFEAPLIVGTVGGVTTLHPTAKLAMRMMQIQSANDLSRIMAAVGLVQNLGALRALTTVGIIEGHMKLHIKNLALGAGAEEVELPSMVQKLEEILAIRKRISLSNAVEVLKELRSART